MRIWRFPFTVVLAQVVFFNMQLAVEAAMYYERQVPSSTPATLTQAPGVSTSFPSVVSTITIQDGRPRSTDATASGIGSSPAASTTSPGQTAGGTLEASPTANTSSLSAAASLHPWDVDPVVVPDAPVTAVFLVLFLVGAAVHAWRGHRINMANKRHLRPTLSVVVLVFCVLRVLTCGLRLGWATQPGNEGLEISEMVVLNIGSVIIYMASAILAQRLVRHYALTSLSGSTWRLVVFWLSNLVLVMASLSSIAIIVVYSVGTSQFANVLASNGTSSGDDPLVALALLRTGVAWLCTLGALYILLVAIVVVTARTVPGKQDRLGSKLAVYFIGVVLLDIGQGFRLAALFLAEAAMGPLVFYVTGFALELLVVLLYAVADLDRLFGDGRTNSSTSATKTMRPGSAPLGLFRNDEQGEPRRDEKAATAEPANKGGIIIIRKSLDISVTRLGKAPAGRAGNARPRSVASDTADNSTISDSASRISEIHFPTAGSSRPAPAHTAPARNVLPHGGEQPHLARARSVKKQTNSKASPGSGFAGPLSYPPLSPYDSLTKPNRAGLHELEQQLDDYEKDMELPEDQKGLH